MLAGEIELVNDLKNSLRAPRLRTISQFAEEEIIVPNGPKTGRFKLSRHPAMRLLFNEIESDRWRRIFVTGPNQDGKSLGGFVIPSLYKVFERRETVVLGVPDINMVADKWRIDLLPVIKASQYIDQLPSSGSGSRGGDSVLFEFRDGGAIRFMTSGGDDQSRAGFTTPNLVVTEVDGFDKTGGNSREGTKFGQLERRTLAFVDQARLTAEGTVSTEGGRTWQEIKHGSDSKIALQCPHCKAWVTPEREHFVGWQSATSELEARKLCHIACPECGAAWTKEERIQANQQAVLVHKGQSVDADGNVIGAFPDTDTLGFRWSCVNSLLNPDRLSLVGGIEWKAQRATDEEAAERDVLQSQWAMPAKPTRIEVNALDYASIMQRTIAGMGRGQCPDNTQCVTVGVDCGKWLVHWAAISWQPNATPHIPEYDVQDVPSSVMSEEHALLAALRTLRDETILQGWQLKNGLVQPTFVFIDAGYLPGIVQQFCKESGENFFAVKGFGVLQRRMGDSKRDAGSKVIHVGEKYVVVRQANGDLLVEANVDHWKSFLHTRLKTPLGQPGALTLFDPKVILNQSNTKSVVNSAARALASNVEHLTFAKHMMSEREFEDWDAEKGTVIRFESISRKNHYLDSAMLACVAGWPAGVRLMEQPTTINASTQTQDEGDSLGNHIRKW